MSFDPQAHRQASLEAWEDASSGWARRQHLMRSWGELVSQRMIAAIDPQPGQAVLELAAGMGETGMLAARLVAPEGVVTISDQAEGMLAGARDRARELGLENLDFKAFNAEWIDLPLASMDAILCRYGYMLMADPGAALAETRRVLRPGGRVALAVWDTLDANPWAQMPALELRARGLGALPGEGFQPGPFALGSEEQVLALLLEAGFVEPAVEIVEMTRTHESFDEFWEITLDLSRSTHDAVLSLPAAEGEEIKAAVAERFADYTEPDGSLSIPGRTLVATAEA
jgi:SAM-dependent methyltransferase